MKRKTKRRPPPSMPAQVGVARYQKEHWPRWLEVADDRDDWEPTFEDWEHHARGMVSRLKQAGLEVVWIDLEPESFAEWCRARGYKNDGEARSRFAAEKIGNIPPPGRPAAPTTQGHSPSAVAPRNAESGDAVWRQP